MMRDRLIAVAKSLRPVWSKPAALRAVRVTLVMPALFAFTSQVVGNVQMATFAAFGSFATLLFANFGGTRRDKLVAHTVLAVAGSVLIIIGTAASFNTAVAAVVTVPVTFCVLFSGIVGRNAASGAVAALVAYVLPATSRAPFSVVPDRLAGWWLASVFGPSPSSCSLPGPRVIVCGPRQPSWRPPWPTRSTAHWPASAHVRTTRRLWPPDTT